MSGYHQVRTVGVAGALFGGTVAALTAQRLHLPLMALWQPVVDGPAYVRALLRSEVTARVVRAARDGSENAGVGEQTLRDDLRVSGRLDASGLLLTAESLAAFEAIHLATDVDGFSGSALILTVSASGRPQDGVMALAERLRTNGARCDVDDVVDRSASVFGRLSTSKGVDQTFDLVSSIITRTVAWSRAAVPSEAEGPT
jgi:hypothetical protein